MSSDVEGRCKPSAKSQSDEADDECSHHGEQSSSNNDKGEQEVDLNTKKSPDQSKTVYYRGKNGRLGLEREGKDLMRLLF